MVVVHASQEYLKLLPEGRNNAKDISSGETVTLPNMLNEPEDMPNLLGKVLNRPENTPDSAEDVPDLSGKVLNRSENAPDSAENVPNNTEDLPNRSENVPDSAENMPDKPDSVPNVSDLNKREKQILSLMIENREYSSSEISEC